MKKYAVTIRIAIHAVSKKEAREKAEAVLTRRYYKGKYLTIGDLSMKTADVEEIG